MLKLAGGNQEQPPPESALHQKAALLLTVFTVIKVWLALTAAADLRSEVRNCLIETHVSLAGWFVSWLVG